MHPLMLQYESLYLWRSAVYVGRNQIGEMTAHLPRWTASLHSGFSILNSKMSKCITIIQPPAFSLAVRFSDLNGYDVLELSVSRSDSRVRLSSCSLHSTDFFPLHF